MDAGGVSPAPTGAPPERGAAEGGGEAGCGWAARRAKVSDTGMAAGVAAERGVAPAAFCAPCAARLRKAVWIAWPAWREAAEIDSGVADCGMRGFAGGDAAVPASGFGGTAVSLAGFGLSAGVSFIATRLLYGRGPW